MDNYGHDRFLTTIYRVIVFIVILDTHTLYIIIIKCFFQGPGRSNINFPGAGSVTSAIATRLGQPRSSWDNHDFSSVPYINFLVVFFLVVPDPGK